MEEKDLPAYSNTTAVMVVDFCPAVVAEAAITGRTTPPPSPHPHQDLTDGWPGETACGPRLN